MRKSVIPVAAVVLALLLGAGTLDISYTAGADVPRIARSELKAQLGQADIIVLDVRRDSDWNSSSEKIKGAARENPAHFRNWADKYPRDKTIVLYCA